MIAIGNGPWPGGLYSVASSRSDVVPPRIDGIVVGTQICSITTSRDGCASAGIVQSMANANTIARNAAAHGRAATAGPSGTMEDLAALPDQDNWCPISSSLSVRSSDRAR